MPHIHTQQEDINSAITVIDSIKNNPATNKINKQICTDLLDSMIWKKKQESEISWFDAYYFDLDDISDNDMYKILYRMTGKNWEWMSFFNNETPSINSEEAEQNIRERVNYILETAARHYIREYSEFSDNVKPIDPTKNSNLSLEEKNIKEDELQHNIRKRPWIPYFIRLSKGCTNTRCTCKRSPQDKKRKVYFNIQSFEDFKNFIQNITWQNKEDPLESDLNKRYNYVSQSMNWMFIKNIISFVDLENNPIYQNQKTSFTQINREVIGACFNQPKENFKRDDIEEIDAHQLSFKNEFFFHINNKDIPVTIEWNTKSQNSLIDKMLRSPEYSQSKAINDLIRYSIIIWPKDSPSEMHQNIIDIIHHVIDYFYQNPENKFNTNKELFIKNKWLLKDDEYVLDLPDGKSKDLILQTIFNESSTITNNTGKKYTDVKLIMPVKIRWKLFNIEVKCLPEWYEANNESWLSDHRIMKLKERIESICRWSYLISEAKINALCKKLLQENPDLKENLKKEFSNDISEWTAIWEDIDTIIQDKLIKDVKSSLTEISPGHYSHKTIHIRRMKHNFIPRIKK